ncbi:MAG: DNA polymerase III subunit delta' [Ramlibacter sp.]|nr:DNA polymerase III subunit delta' [Ramlibacter sp.]
MSAPWIAAQAERLIAQRGHAWLLQGPSGLGQYSLALDLARAWLCDRPTATGACGTCDSCHAIDVHGHTDLEVLMPETVMMELGWPLAEKAQSDIDDKKRKASKEIRVEAMRDVVEFAQRTSGRGRGKVVMVYPAERMNNITANTLLKTLEEPAGDTRFVLASEASHQLLPTIRSRCLGHVMSWPSVEEATGWLAGEGVAEGDIAGLLKAAGGRPEDALALARSGADPAAWSRMPKAIARGEAGLLANWGAAQVIDAMLKVCHDLAAVKAGAQPRFFERNDLPPAPAFNALNAWSRELMSAARNAEHPLNAGLMLEALVSQARSALHSRP